MTYTDGQFFAELRTTLEELSHSIRPGRIPVSEYFLSGQDFFNYVRSCYLTVANETPKAEELVDQEALIRDLLDLAKYSLYFAAHQRINFAPDPIESEQISVASLSSANRAELFLIK